MISSKQKFLEKVKKYKNQIADFDITEDEINNHIIEISKIIKILEQCELSNAICGAEGYHFKLIKNKDGIIELTNFTCPKNKNNMKFVIKNNFWYINNDIINNYQKLQKKDIFIENEYAIRTSLINTLLKIKRGKININGLYIQGDFSSGKSYILTAFCNEMALLNHSIIYLSMNSFCLDIMKSIQDLSPFKNEIVEQMLEVDVLVIDDIGSDIFRDIIHTQLIYPVLNYRMNANKLTLFSSKFSINDLKKSYKINNSSKQVDQLIDKIIRISTPYIFNISLNKKISS